MVTAFFIGLGVMCAITGLLAILMVVADATIANYGEVQITVNDDQTHTVDGGRSLLSTLKDAKIFVPSACGGRGSCGLCKVTVLAGAGEPLPTEIPWLSPEEIQNQVRLSCQIKVKNDLRIAVPEEWFNVKPYEGVVTSIRDLTYDIKEVRVKLVEPEEILFKAGQFIQFEVPAYELTDEPVYRAYSLSSDPALKNEVEMEIRYVPNGICTTYVHRHLKEGDTVTMNGPHGDFYLRDTDRPIFFIAGGSGMAPVKSILHQMVNTGNRRRAVYFFGARAVRDLFLVDEMKQFEQKLADFRFVPALSDPRPDDRWEGATGLVTQVVDREISDASGAEAYLCGSPLMIDACIEVLRKKGMPEDQIFYDKFA